jgi:hypothetical protein
VIVVAAIRATSYDACGDGQQGGDWEASGAASA